MAKRVLAAVFTAAVAVGGVATVAVAAPASPATQQNVPISGNSYDADGKALFAGLLFSQGEVAKKLANSGLLHAPNSELAKNNTPEGRKAITSLTSDIARKDPRFFTELSTSLRSGDPRKVEHGLEAANKKLNAVAKKGDQDLGVGKGVNIAAVAAVALMDMTTKTRWVDLVASPPAGGPMSKDEMVARMAKQLHLA
ncbi:hypothetical protein AB0C96_35600 [Streptomyces sp. NPDC048506]|uniref:hypothetical protein n=1 Tax=Streptomyces sp. NPDC048506 TaxID=3155028 RepID=UPI00343463BC